MAVALDVAVVLHAHRARLADPAQIVAARGRRASGARRVPSRPPAAPSRAAGPLPRSPAPPRPGDRVRGRPAVLHRDQRLRARADDRKVQSASCIGHVAADTCTGSGWSPAASGTRRAGRRRCPSRTAATAPPGTPRLPRCRRRASRRSRRTPRRVRCDRCNRLGPAERRHRRRQVLAERGRHHVQPGDRVVVGPVDALVGAVPVHRVGDQRDRALVVVDRGDVGGQQQQHVGQPEIVDRQRRAAAPAVGPCRRRRTRPGRRTAAAGPATARSSAARASRAAPAADRRRCGASCGVSPSHTASPSRTVSADGAPAPMNDHRDHDRPFSADSSKNVPGRLAASLRYADSGVSLSASTLRVTGTTRCSAASARKSSREVVIARLAVAGAGGPPLAGESEATGGCIARQSSQTGSKGPASSQA